MTSVREPIPVADACCAPLTAAALDEDQATDLAAVLKALADPVRLRLVSIIASAPAGEVCACDLPAALDRSQPTISHHLTQLTRAGLINREQRGKWAWFSIRADGFAAIRAALGDATPVAVPAAPAAPAVPAVQA